RGWNREDFDPLERPLEEEVSPDPAATAASADRAQPRRAPARVAIATSPPVGPPERRQRRAGPDVLARPLLGRRGPDVIDPVVLVKGDPTLQRLVIARSEERRV